MIPTTPANGAEAPALGQALDADLRAGASSGVAQVEPRLEVNDKNADAALRLLRELARSGA